MLISKKVSLTKELNYRTLKAGMLHLSNKKKKKELQ
jgi:hypothetical protein